MTLEPNAAETGDAGGSAKLAEQLSRRLEANIQANGWPHGHYLGHEEQLAKDFGVSRPIFREAIAIGEWEGFLESRRGREGGLYVCAPTADAAIAALRNYLFLTGATLEELLQGRATLETYVLELAIQRMDIEQATRLKALHTEHRTVEDDRVQLDRLRRIVDYLAEAAGLPPLGVFSASLRHCYVDRVRTTLADDAAYLRASRAVADLRMLQVEAIVACNLVAALDLQTRALAIWREFQETAAVGTYSPDQAVERLVKIDRDALIYEFVRPVKKSEAVARVIAQRVASGELAAGDRLGVEAELIRDLGVGRGVFREAVRILERFGIVGVERGKYGGLSVALPRIDALLRITRRSLRSTCADQPEEFRMLAQIIHQEAARKAAQLVADGDPSVRARVGELRGGLPPALDERSGRRLMDGVSRELASLCGDRVLGCLTLVLHDLVRDRSDDGATETDWPLVRARLDHLLRAIEMGDALLAPRHMLWLSKAAPFLAPR